ncbi:hypothetical protein [Acinetobacter sp. UBA801]|uniref:hypothetical protein n=1 Tax=Acinetobacter sp. UBA801 TaxID=1945958 RepID=UPI0025BA8451|nr:hypothetical protein [Acinetobacter sp. UBA801]
MDIQKEKIAHEKHLLSQGVDFKYLPNIQYNELENVYELIEWDEEYGEALNEINSSWCTWQAAKANAIPDGFVVVPRKSIEHWYLDEGESLWMDEPDNWLCDMYVGDIQEVKHKEYIVTESNTLYATKIWDDENQDVSTWEFFNSKDDAEKAAEYCKAMIEAQEPIND